MRVVLCFIYCTSTKKRCEIAKKMCEYLTVGMNASTIISIYNKVSKYNK